MQQKPNWGYYMLKKYSTMPTLPRGLYIDVWV